jgi:protein translocase SecG subunit
MTNFLLLSQTIVAASLVILILLQVKGTGFGRVWGNQASQFSRRGLEAFVFKLTFVIAGLFIIISILQLIV